MTFFLVLFSLITSDYKIINPNINPLSPDIKMHILITDLPTFLIKLVRRICQKLSRHPVVSDHFLYSCHLNIQTSSDHVKRNFIFIGG